MALFVLRVAILWFCMLLWHSNKLYSNKLNTHPSQIALAISFSSKHCPLLIVIFSL